MADLRTDSENINMKLTELIKEVETDKKALLELFSVTTSEASAFKPLNVTIEAAIPTSYNSKNTTFNYNPNDTNPLLMSAGEEVSHYIHHQINPKVWKDIPSENIFQYRCTIEFVGHYGMLCLFANLNKPLPSVPILKQTIMTDDPREFETSLIHKISYEHAHECFKRHRATKLPMLSRMEPQLLEIYLHRLAPITWIHKKILPLYDRITRSPYRNINS